jgi:hypothetical protein
MPMHACPSPTLTHTPAHTHRRLPSACRSLTLLRSLASHPPPPASFFPFSPHTGPCRANSAWSTHTAAPSIRYVPVTSQSALTTRKTLFHHRVLAFERRVLAHWPTFTIWGAGRDGKTFFNALTRPTRARVAAFCDIDPKKVPTPAQPSLGAGSWEYPLHVQHTPHLTASSQDPPPFATHPPHTTLHPRRLLLAPPFPFVHLCTLRSSWLVFVPALSHWACRPPSPFPLPP